MAACGANHIVRCRTADLFPAPANARYVPVEGDALTERCLWDQELWPIIFAEWQRTGATNGTEFYCRLKSESVNPDRQSGALSFNTRTLAYEMRCYLWHLFRFFDRVLNEHLTAHKFELARWSWAQLLYLLLTEFRAAAVTFNYDLILERVIRAIGSYPGGNAVISLCVTLENFPFSVGTLPANTVVIHKVHGGIQFHLSTGIDSFVTGYRPTPWLNSLNVARNIVNGTQVEVDWSLTKMPFIPDMVPPGRAGDDIVNPALHVREHSQSQVKASDLVIWCGLSATEIDHEEVKALVKCIKSDATVIHVGLASDRENALARLLDNATVKSKHFIDATLEFPKIQEILRQSFQFKNTRY